MLPAALYAVAAGFLAALASSSAKLSLGSDYIKNACEIGMKTWINGQDIHAEENINYCDWLHIPLRILCGGLLFSCNAVMWTFFAKSLRHSSSSARATVTTTAANFIFTAFLGHLIFGERNSALWWVGMILTLMGLFILHGASRSVSLENIDKKNE